MKPRLKFGIATKLLGSFLLVSVISLGILGYFSLIKMNQMGKEAEEHSITLGSSAVIDSTRILEVLVESSIQQKAEDVARQIRIYLEQHALQDQQEVMQTQGFIKLALQAVGETGYTCLLEKGTGVITMHPNPEMVNFDTHNWIDQFPEFWAIYEKSLAGTTIASGYYKWPDPDGKVREKYMCLVPIDSTQYAVQATTYLDEFSKPIVLLENRVAVDTAEATDNIQATIENTRNFFIVFFVVVILVVVLLVFYLARMITRPIKTLTEGSEAIGGGDLDHRVEIHTGDELEDLANSFNRMSADLKNFTTELRRTTAEKERVEKELEIARGIQQSFLPERPPEVPGFDLAALSQPAKEVGGDFYDFIPVGSQKWGLVIADVSGKGVPAALFMALSRTLVRANVSDDVTVSEAIRKSNDLIAENDRSNMFVTLFYGVLDPQKATLTYVSAGHNPPIMLRRGPNDIIMLQAKGVALGVLPGIGLEEKEISLGKGDVVILYTDGVTEAINESEEQFNHERIIAIAEENRDLPAVEIVERIKDGVLEFSRGQPQFDDITLMVLKVQ